MIPAVAQTLANILVAGTSITSAEQIDFGYPHTEQNSRTCLNLFFYSIQESQQSPTSTPVSSQPERSSAAQTLVSVVWFDLLFLLIACDRTSLGEQRLLSEALTLLRCYQTLPEAALAPSLQGYDALPFSASTVQLSEMVALWNALQCPLRPALRLSVTAPLELNSMALPAYSELFPVV